MRKRIAGVQTICLLFHASGSVPILSLTASLSRCLFTAEIFLSGLHRDVAQQELNLFQLAPGAVAETGTRPSKIMWRELCNSHLGPVLLDKMPHHPLAHFGAPSRSPATDANEITARGRHWSLPANRQRFASALRSMALESEAISALLMRI